MALDKEKKQEIIQQFRTHETDSGSPEVQIALLTARIAKLSEHLKTHKKDVHSRRGLIRMVNQRKKLLSYLARKDYQRYKAVIERLNLRR